MIGWGDAPRGGPRREVLPEGLGIRVEGLGSSHAGVASPHAGLHMQQAAVQMIPCAGVTYILRA